MYIKPQELRELYKAIQLIQVNEIEAVKQILINTIDSIFNRHEAENDLIERLLK